MELVIKLTLHDNIWPRRNRGAQLLGNKHANGNEPANGNNIADNNNNICHKLNSFCTELHGARIEVQF
jgi:hypothetical protein